MAANPDYAPLLYVERLSVEYSVSGGKTCVAVSDATLRLGAGEIIGIFGQSGSGKTSFGLALLDLLPTTAKRQAHALRLRGHDLLKLNQMQMRNVRGKVISIMYQEPALALNPVMRVGDQIAEIIAAHQQTSQKERRERVWNLLKMVRLADRRGIYDAYPHELSGGERHRIVIAQAVSCHPLLVIADEPTAGLDAELKPEIMDVMARLREELNVSFLLISHDRKMLARLADRTFEMAQGRIHESAAELSPSTPSVRLRPALPKLTKPQSHPDPLVMVRGLSKSCGKGGVLFRSSSPAQALHDVNAIIPGGSTLGLVGPSGSGKSTLARCLALWERPDAGEMLFRGENITKLRGRKLRRIRPRIQLVLQDSAAAFNPNLTAEEIVAEPLVIEGQAPKQERRFEVIRRLEEVGLDESMLARRPLEFSGGQRQRLAIARALILNPELIIFDESTTGLDSGTARQIIALLQNLQRSRHLTYLVISHDIDLVIQMADQIVIMRDGTIVNNVPVAESLGKSENFVGSELSQSQVKEAVASGESR